MSLFLTATHTFTPKTLYRGRETPISSQYTPPTHINSLKTLCRIASKQQPVGEESPPGELPAADPSCSCRTSYIPAAVLIRTTPRPPTTLPPPHPDSPHPRAHQLPHTQCNTHPPLRIFTPPNFDYHFAKNQIKFHPKKTNGSPPEAYFANYPLKFSFNG